MTKCLNCGSELVPNAKFCMECATPVPQKKICPSCNTELPPQAKFCFNCGANLAVDNISSSASSVKTDNADVDNSIGAVATPNNITNETKKEIIVDLNGHGDAVSISEALKLAGDDSTIVVRPGVYRDSFIVDKHVIIYGEDQGNGLPVIWNDTEEKHYVMRIDADAKISDLIFRGANNPFSDDYEYRQIPKGVDAWDWWPRVIEINSNCRLKNIDVCNSAGYGIAVAGADLDPQFNECKVHDNARMGFQILEGVKGLIANCSIYKNHAHGICALGTKTLVKKSTINDNTKSGIAVFYKNELIIDSCCICNNHDNVYVWGEDADPQITCCKIHGGCTGIFLSCKAIGCVKNCEIYDSSCGILIEDSAKSQVNSCDLRNNFVDIKVRGAGTNPSVTNCTCSDSTESLEVLDGAEGCYRSCTMNSVQIKGKDTNPTIVEGIIHHGSYTCVYAGENCKGLIENVWIHSSAEINVYLSDGADLHLKNCKITGAKYRGIFFLRSKGLLDGCILNYNDQGNRDEYPDLSDREKQMKNSFYMANKAIDFGEDCNPVIRNCRIYDEEKPIAITSSARALIEDSFIYDCYFSAVRELNCSSVIVKNTVIDGHDAEPNNYGAEKNLHKVDGYIFNSYKDERDGQIYRTVKIGNQEWLAENYNYQNSDKYTRRGNSYDWKQAKRVCPEGWRLPSKEDYQTLKDNIGKHFKLVEEWKGEDFDHGDPFAGTCYKNALSAFSAIPTDYDSAETQFWTSTERDEDKAVYILAKVGEPEFKMMKGARTKSCYVRLIKE